FQAEDGIRDFHVTGVQTCALPIFTRQPQLARVFEQVGVDYCCGGKKTLQEACEAKGLDAQTLVLALQAVASSAPQETELNLSSRSEERRVGKERRARGAPGH